MASQSVFRYLVTIEADSEQEADTVMAERLAHDEEYENVGDYSVDWEFLSSEKANTLFTAYQPNPTPCPAHHYPHGPNCPTTEGNPT